MQAQNLIIDEVRALGPEKSPLEASCTGRTARTVNTLCQPRRCMALGSSKTPGRRI